MLNFFLFVCTFNTKQTSLFKILQVCKLLACLPHVKFLQPIVFCMHICVAGYVWLNLYLFVPVPFCCQDDRDPQNNCWSETAMFMEMSVFCFNASRLLHHFKFFNIFIVFFFNLIKKNFIIIFLSI